MPPAIYPKPYPLTKGLSQFLNTQESSRSERLSLDDATTLAVYGKQHVDPDLKKVLCCLKKPLELFPKIMLGAKLFVTIELDGGSTKQLRWELTIKEAHRNLHCVLDALGVIYQGLFYSKILLNGVEQFLGDKERNEADHDSEQLNFDIEKLKELKENLLNLNKFLDCVLLHYSSFSFKLPCTLAKDVKHAAEKIGKVVNQLKPEWFENLIPYCEVTEEDVLCSVLGLNDNFADRLRNLCPEVRKHKTDMYFLLCFLKERHEYVNVENLRDRAEVLREMGFTENRSNVIAKWIAEQPLAEHKSILAWAEIYVENLFEYDIFLNAQVSKFPYEEDRLNQWFDVKINRSLGDRCEDETGYVPQVSVINAGTLIDVKTHIEEKIADFQKKNPKGQLYFHGTDHNGAKNILEDGIKLGRGKPCCDFSDGGGFYVADHFEYALDWAKKSNAAAIILFSISSDELDSRPGLDLSGPENHDDWLAVTKCFSSGEQNKLNKKLKNLVKNCHYIVGPISRDGVHLDKKWRKDVQQICIRKEEMADEVGDPSRIVGIVFLNTEVAQ